MLAVSSLTGCVSDDATTSASTIGQATTTPTTVADIAFDRALHDELIEMAERDQAGRTGGSDPEGDPARTARLIEIVDVFGWPIFDLVGEDGEDEPVLRHPAHPGADVGDEGTGRIPPVVRDSQRVEGRTHLVATFARTALACWSSSSSSWLRWANRSSIHSSRCLRTRLTALRPSGVRERITWRPSVGSSARAM